MVQVKIRVQSLKNYIKVFGGLTGWAKVFFARAYVLNGTITALRGNEDNEKLMAHEFGHLSGLEHPEDAAKDSGSGLLERAWKKIYYAAKAGFPIMSAWGILRWKDHEGLVQKWKEADKVYV